MQRYIFFTILLFTCNFLFSNTILAGKTYRDKGTRSNQFIEFSETNFHYSSSDLVGNNIEDYSVSYHIVDENGVLYLVCGVDSKKWLALLSDDYIFLYKENGEPFFRGWWTNSKLDPTLFNYYSKDLFNVDSFLIEEINNEQISYSSPNLGTIAIPHPWVEGEDSDGVGVCITGLFNSGGTFKYYLVFSNGYVSYDRPDLYKKNGRVKRVRITDIELGKSKDFELLDTPNLQYIYASDIITGHEGFTIEILDTYRGSKYNDTCINFLGAYYIHNSSSLFDSLEF